MATVSLDAIKRDQVAMSVAHALALANEAALAHGTVPADCLVTISQEPSASGQTWRITYGTREYVNRRGGDLIVLVDEQGESIKRILRGQ